ncbi:MAG: outer membrane lipoprotein-sorting protein [bacterium]|nr:outer membrane lipoprotein-sorting protein [bacterium]
MKKQKKLHKVKNEQVQEKVILVDKRGSKETRIMKRYGRDYGNSSKFLIVFLKPNSIKGTALLTWERKNKKNDQWIYLPAAKKLQRIASGSKKSYFMGTDFTYEDMEPETISNYYYTIIKSEKIKGKDCWVIEAAPKPGKKRLSSYSKRLLWVMKNNYFTVKIKFFDRRKTLVKTQTNYNIHKVRGTVWRAKKAIMNNHKRKHKTVMGTVSRNINSSINSRVFRHSYIESNRHYK